MNKKLLYLFVIFFSGVLSAQQLSEPQQVLNGVNNNFFIANKGQWNPEVKFFARIGGMNAWITGSGVIYDYYKIKREFNKSNILKMTGQKRKEYERKHTIIQGDVVRMQLENSKMNVTVVGSGKEEGHYNYFISNDKSKWVSFVPLYDNIELKGIYKNINVKYYYDKGKLRYDYLAKPGADISQIKFSFKGQKGIAVNTNGDLVIKTSVGEVTNGKIFAYQTEGGIKKQIDCRFKKESDGRIGLSVNNYDVKKELIIDPLIYSTLIGNKDYYDIPSSINIDSSGNAYITGETYSPGYPTTTGAYQTNFRVSDAFITKLNSAGSALIYSTFLGGSDQDRGNSIAIDKSGDTYITGGTISSDFPVTSGAYQTTFASSGNPHAFISKLNSTGSALLYSTYLEGSYSDLGNSIVIDSSGNAYVAGSTESTDFPTTTGAFQKSGGNPTNSSHDVFVTKLNPAGSSLIYSTCIGGTADDRGYSITTDKTGNAYITGVTYSPDYPVTSGAFQTSLKGLNNAFITKLNPTGTALVYSTIIGGSNEDQGNSIVIDTSSNAYITGYTTSSDFPVTSGAYQTTFNYQNAFITKLNPSGTSLVYSTFLGGNYEDGGNSIGIDKKGNTYITGYTISPDFPVTNDAFQTALNNGLNGNAFLTKLSAAGTFLVYSTFFGGSTYDVATSIVVDEKGNAFITGQNFSNDFPTTSGAYQTASDSSGVFAAKFSLPNLGYATAKITSLTNGPAKKLYSIPNNGTGYVYFNMTSKGNPISYQGNFSVVLTDSLKNMYQTAGSLIEPGLLRLAILDNTVTKLGSGPQSMNIQDSILINDTVYHIINTPPDLNIAKIPLTFSRSFDFFTQGSLGAEGVIGAGAGASLDLAKLSITGTAGMGLTINTDQNNKITFSRRFEYGIGADLSVPSASFGIGHVSAGIEAGLSIKTIKNQDFDPSSVVPKLDSNQIKMAQAGFLLETLSMGFGNFSPTVGIFIDAVKYTLLNTSGIIPILNEAVTKKSWGLGLEGTGNLGLGASIADESINIANFSGTVALNGYRNVYPKGSSDVAHAATSYSIEFAENYNISAFKNPFELKINDKVSLGAGNNGLFGLSGGMGTGAEAYFDSSNSLKQLNVWLEDGGGLSMYNGSAGIHYKTLVAVPSAYKNVFDAENFAVNGLLSANSNVIVNSLAGDVSKIVDTLSHDFNSYPIKITTTEKRGKGIDLPLDIDIDAALGVGLGLKLGMDLKYYDEISFAKKYTLLYAKHYNYLMYSTNYSSRMSNFNMALFFKNLYTGTANLVKASFNNIMSTAKKLINAGDNFALNGINKAGKFIGSIQGKMSQTGQAYVSTFSPNYPHVWNSSFREPVIRNFYYSTNILHRKFVKNKTVLSIIKSTMIAVSDNMKISFIPNGQSVSIDSVDTTFTIKIKVDTAKLLSNGFTLADTSRIRIYRYNDINNSWISEGGALHGDTVEANVRFMSNYLLGIELTNADDKTPPQIIDFGPKEGSTLTSFPEIYAKIQDNQYGVGVDWAKTSIIANGDTLDASFDPTNQMIFYNLSSKDSLSGAINVTVRTMDYNGNSDSLSYSFNLNVTGVKGKNIPHSFKLLQNYPNPFNPSTNINYSIKKESSVKVIIFNSIGQYVVTLVNKKQSAGTYTINFDGRRFASGVYFYSLMAKPDDGSSEYRETRKMILLK